MVAILACDASSNFPVRRKRSYSERAPTMAPSLYFALGLLLSFIQPSTTLSWGSSERIRPLDNLSQILQASHRVSDVYAIALTELQELESEPLCHRVAARLLVNNCQLLDGKDEATVLTDSGSQLRDFIDSYAASLAICDLERGRFAIPAECCEFRDTALSRVSISSEATLHVTSEDIDRCLSALGTSDAAWNTWVSYRHKALRFCEAARIDNERAQSVLLYQRLTKILAKLANGVETDLRNRMSGLDTQVRQATENVERMGPHIDRLRQNLADIEDFLSGDLKQRLQSSSDAVKGGMDQAIDLEQLLTALVKSALESSSKMAAYHEQHERSLMSTSKRVDNEVGVLVGVITTAIASSTTLQNQIDVSRQQAAQLSTTQQFIEEGLKRLSTISDQLSSRYDRHLHLLNEAQNMTESVLDALEEAVAAATGLNQVFLGLPQFGRWWPHVAFPITTLVLGSYAIAPSVLRNLTLIAFGEFLGVFYSSREEILTLLSGVSLFRVTNSTLDAL
ncbi:hypothetical protein VTK73DRAFT_5388 [Phialemonium thermophilum]|uniref:Nuclear fusion protein KAR5 n=1 Tax=Phialemonium thermophilum TaxID=223376 RepID=A0ABR3XX44_9PEZI